MATSETEEKVAPATGEKPAGRRVSKRKATEAVGRSYFDALARRDAGAMASHWTSDGVEEILPVGMLRGPREIESFFRETFAAVPDAETSVGRVIAGDGQVAVEWRMEGHFTGTPFQGIEPTGKRIEVRGFDLLEIEDGKIRSNTAYYDGAAFARQVGMLPAQDSGAERAMKTAFNSITKARRAIAQRGGS